MPGGRIFELPRGRTEPAPPVPVTAQTLDQVRHEPLRALASEALGRGEEVRLLLGALEDGSRVETLLFPEGGRAAQSTGSWVFSGLWSGTHVLTLSGHSLDHDGYCFCRACDLANGYEQQDED
jgi:hypothetical protein